MALPIGHPLHLPGHTTLIHDVIPLAPSPHSNGRPLHEGAHCAIVAFFLLGDLVFSSLKEEKESKKEVNMLIFLKFCLYFCFGRLSKCCDFAKLSLWYIIGCNSGHLV